jgi:hypothetical protein
MNTHLDVAAYTCMLMCANKCNVIIPVDTRIRGRQVRNYRATNATVTHGSIWSSVVLSARNESNLKQANLY